MKDERCKEGRGDAAKKPKLSEEHKAVYGNEVPAPLRKPLAPLFPPRENWSVVRGATCGFLPRVRPTDVSAKDGARWCGGLETFLRAWERRRCAFAGRGPSTTCNL